MYNYDDIIARLRAGEDSEVIAKEMVDTLNRANRDFVDEQNKISETKNQKANMIGSMMNTLETYVRQFHPKNPIVKMFDNVDAGMLDINELVEQIDDAIEQYAQVAHLMDSIKGDLEKVLNARVPSQRPASGKITPNPDALDAFLKANGLA